MFPEGFRAVLESSVELIITARKIRGSYFYYGAAAHRVFGSAFVHDHFQVSGAHIAVATQAVHAP